MDWINRQLPGKVVVAIALLCVCGWFIPSGLAEEGDSPLEAYFLPYDTELEGAIGAEFTSDYYKVIVPATGRLVVSLYDIQLNHAADELHMTLLRTTQNSVGTSYTTYELNIAQSANDAATPDIIDIPDLARGVYFVSVWPARSGNWDGCDYKLQAEFSVFPPVVSDDVGDQRQYALPTVNQLQTNCTLSGDDDVDYFECHVPYNTDLTLSLTDIGSGGNVDMEVYTALDVLIGSAAQVGDVNEFLYLEDLVPGQYFVKVSGEGTPQYTFTATQEFAQATDIFDDVGNGLVHAMPLLPGNPSVFCLQPYNGETDCFSIYQPEDGAFTVDVYNMFFWDGGEDLYVDVFDEYGNIVAQTDNDRLVPEHIEVNLARGQYFIKVYGQRSGGFNGAIYTINAETSGHDVGDAFNQAMQIHAIPYGTETYGYPYIGMIDRPGDADFFQVVLKDSGFIYLEVDRMLHSNVDVQLFDAYHALLQTSANLDTQTDVIYVDNLDAGLYFIKVYSLDDEIGQYRLTPTISTPTSPIGDDLGDDTSRAFPLVPYRRVDGYMWSDNTSDFFEFTLDALNSLVRVHVDPQHLWDGGEDVYLRVHNAEGIVLGLSDNDRLEDEILEFIDLEPGTYYAEVTPQRSGTMNAVQYSIVVETDAAPLPTGQLYLSDDVKGVPGQMVYVPLVLDNTEPDEISSVTVGVQFDPDILQAVGVSHAGLTLGQWDAQVRYAHTFNTMSVSMDNFSTTLSGELLNLIFQVQPDASPGSASALIVLTSDLNGATVPGDDGSVTVAAGN